MLTEDKFEAVIYQGGQDLRPAVVMWSWN